MGNMKILNTNTAIYTIELHEAKVVPFKKLEQAWTRTKGDKAKQAKLIKKYDLKTLISTVRPGSIKLGVMNKLNHVNGNATAAGIDLDGELIFITNNPLKIIYPKKSSRRPEGEEIEEADDGAIVEEKKSLSTLRLEKIASLAIKEDDQGLIEAFVKTDTFSIDSTPSKIKEAYKIFEASADWIIYDKKTGKQLSPSKSWRKWQGAKAAASKIGGDAEVADAAWYQDNKAKLMGEATDLEEAIKVKTHRGMYSMKKGEESLRNWVDRIVIMSDAVKKNQRKIVAQNIVKAIETGKIKNADLTQDLGTLIGVKAPSGMEAPKSVVKDRMKELNLLESTDKELDIKSLKDLIKNPSPKMIKQYGGKDKYIKMLKSKLAKLESVDLEEVKNATVRELRQMLFKTGSDDADAFRHVLFNVKKQDSPATNAQIKKAKKIIGNRFGKDAFVQLEAKGDKQPEVDTIGESVDLEEDYQKVLDKMVKNGSNKKEAEALMKRLYPYVDKTYRSSSVSKKAEIIVSLAASESTDLNEVTAGQLALLDTQQLMTFYSIFSRVSSPRGKEMTQKLKRELSKRDDFNESTDLDEEITFNDVIRGGARVARVLKKSASAAKVFLKATIAVSKKVGGAIGELMSDPEFQAIFKKYSEDPTDELSLKRAQMYLDPKFGDSQSPHFSESTDLEEAIVYRDIRHAIELLRTTPGATKFRDSLMKKDQDAEISSSDLKKAKEIFANMSAIDSANVEKKRKDRYFPRFGVKALEEMNEGQTGNVIATAAAAFAANAVKNTVKGRLTRSGRAERLTKKADAADKKAEDLAKIKRAKERLKAQKAKAKEEKEKAQARKAKARERKRQESADLEEATFYKPKVNRESETITFVNDAEAKQAEKLFTSMKLKVKRSGKRISFINTAEFKSAKSKVMAESVDLEEATAKVISIPTGASMQLAKHNKRGGYWEPANKKTMRVTRGGKYEVVDVEDRYNSGRFYIFLANNKHYMINASAISVVKEAATWKSEGHYTADGKEWTGDQHAHDGQVMTGKVHTDDSVNLYHFKELSPEVRKQVAASFE